jgi:hypothetical protein
MRCLGDSDGGSDFAVVWCGTAHWWGAGHAHHVGRLGLIDVGVPAGVFGGGGHQFGCRHWRWQRCCIAAVKMGTTTTLSSSSSMVHAVFLLARIVSRRWRRRVPTWLLPVRCLYLPSPSSFLLFSSLFPTPYSFLPFSLLQACIEQVIDLAFGFIRSRWWWWVGWTNRHQAVVGRWQCGTRWGGTSDPLIRGIRGCGGCETRWWWLKNLMSEFEALPK